MTNKRILSAVYSAIPGGFVFVFLNILLNPGFGGRQDIFHLIESHFTGVKYFMKDFNIALFVILVILFFAIMVLYALILMCMIKDRLNSDAILIAIASGIGLYIIRMPFFINNSGFGAYFIQTWQILVIYLILSIYLAWQYIWFRRRFELMVKN